MNDDDTLSPSLDQPNAFLPLVLISLTLIILFIWQLTNFSQQKDAFRTTQAQMEGAFQASTPQDQQLIAQSKAVQAKLEGLVTDLLALARSGDADANAIIEKYKIQQNAPAAAAGASPGPAASVAASPSPAR